MPTVRSSTDRGSWVRPIADVGHLLRFRASRVRRKLGLYLGLGLMAGLTIAAATIPAYVQGAGDSPEAFNFLLLMPTALAGFLVLVVISAIASGGGRELIGRDQGVAFPVSPTTDHLGALLMAPLNVAWLLQGWALLGAEAYALGPQHLLSAGLVMLGWIFAATAIGQLVAWSMEWVRRGPRGIVIARVLAGVMVGAVAIIQLTGNVSNVLDKLPLTTISGGALAFPAVGYWKALAIVVGLFLGAVLLGILPAHAAARRPARDELKLESAHYEARPDSRSDLVAAVRFDRSSVWRVVSMRRGLMVLCIGPGLVAFAGDLPWKSVAILPGLVASGGALLFGVNAWSLDARGVLWRESLPVAAGTVFAARTIILFEWLGVASLITLALASLRAGVPTPAELSAVLTCLVVVTLQVVATVMRWSGRSPHSVDLRSARATPAPPLQMVGYSSRLAVTTTLTSLIFSGLGQTGIVMASPLFALPFLLWSVPKLLRARRLWLVPQSRSRIVSVVAA